MDPLLVLWTIHLIHTQINSTDIGYCRESVDENFTSIVIRCREFDPGECPCYGSTRPKAAELLTIIRRNGPMATIGSANVLFLKSFLYEMVLNWFRFISKKLYYVKCFWIDSVLFWKRFFYEMVLNWFRFNCVFFLNFFMKWNETVLIHFRFDHVFILKVI